MIKLFNKVDVKLLKKVMVWYVLLSSCLFIGEAIAASPFDNSKIKDISSLATEVKTQVQGKGVTMVANVIGLVTLVIGAVSTNWRLFGFAGAALAFINIYFPFVNNSLGS